VPPQLHPAKLGPFISGNSSWLDGTYVWTDCFYDDHDDKPGGDGEGGYSASKINAADIIQVQLGLTNEGWWARFMTDLSVDFPA
jgi:hypothetical protein